MPQNQLKRYLEAGMQFTAMTQQRAEAIVRDLVRAGEVQGETAQTLVNDILDRSRKNSEKLLDQVRTEVQRQLSVAEVVTKDVMGRMQSQIDDIRSQLGVRPRPAAKKAAAKRAPAKKAPAKKAPAKRKAAAKKAPAKKAPAKNAPAPQE